MSRSRLINAPIGFRTLLTTSLPPCPSPRTVTPAPPPLPPPAPGSGPRSPGAAPASGAGPDSGAGGASDPEEAPAPPSGHRSGEGAKPPGSPLLDADGDRLPDGEWVAAQRKDANAMGVGLQFGLVVGVFAFAGLKADEHFDTSPWLLLASVALAFIGSTISLLKRFA